MVSLGGPSPQEELVSTLKRAIFMRESQQAASLFQQVQQRDPEFKLEPKRQFELARLLELGNEPNLALLAYQAIITGSKPDEELLKPSLRAAGHLCYRVKDFRGCRTYLEQFLTQPTIAANERADAEGLLTKLPDGKGVRDQASIEASKKKLEPRLDSSGISFDGESQFASLNDTDDELAAPDAEYGEGSRVQGIQLYVEDVPEPPKAPAKRPNLKLANLTHFPGAPGQDLPPPPPKYSPFGEMTPQEQPAKGAGGAPRLSADEMQGMMFGAEPPSPKRSSDDEAMEKFAKTPPLSMHARDVQKKANSDYQVSTTRVKQPEPYHDLPTTDEIPNEARGYTPKPVSKLNPNPEISNYAAPLFDATPSKRNIHEFETLNQEEDSAFNEPQQALFGTPAHSSRHDETSPNSGKAYEELLECYQSQKFALILPLGAKISISQVAQFLVNTENLSEDEARKAVVDRKGCLRSRLSLAQAVELYQQTARFQQTFSFVVLRREFENAERLNASKVDVLTPGIRLHTEQGVKKLRWEKVRFITCGRLDRLPTVDLFVDEDLKHYRLQEGGMKFLELYPRSDEDYNEACKEFLRYLTKASPEAEVSHTVRNLLNGKTYRPQKFASTEEYDLYNYSLLLGHFGENVPMKELSLAFSSVSSAW